MLYSELVILFSISGLVAVSYAVAYCVSILVEMPTLGITKVLIGKSSQDGQKSSPMLTENGRDLHQTLNSADA